MSDGDGYDYRIELEDKVVETNSWKFALLAFQQEDPDDHTELETEHVPMQMRDDEPDIDVDRLEKLCRMCRTRAEDDSLSSSQRGTYYYLHVKLRKVLDGEPWMEGTLP